MAVTLLRFCPLLLLLAAAAAPGGSAHSDCQRRYTAGEARAIVLPFYTQALTVNDGAGNPAKILGRILRPTFRSYGGFASAEASPFEPLSKTKNETATLFAAYWERIPDMEWLALDFIVGSSKDCHGPPCNDKVVVRSVASGTPVRGDFMGVPTNGTARFLIDTIDIHQLKCGKIGEVYHVEDWQSAIAQLKNQTNQTCLLNQTNQTGLLNQTNQTGLLNQTNQTGLLNQTNQTQLLNQTNQTGLLNQTNLTR